MIRKTALALVLLCLFPAPAQAVQRANVAPASHVYGDALVRAASADADRWWLEVIGRAPPSLELFVYDMDDEGIAYGDYGTGRVWLTRHTRDYFWSFANSRYATRRERRGALAYLWSVMAHERGHNLGLPHHAEAACPSNIMCGVPTIPGRARAWALTLIPKRGPLKLPATNIDRAGNSG